MYRERHALDLYGQSDQDGGLYLCPRANRFMGVSVFPQDM